MPTTYPKCSPTEMMGLMVLLNDHKGSEDVAILGDDLDLELDEILPALDFAEALGLLATVDGRATLTDAGKKLLAGSIRERKTILREQLKRTTLYKALMRALESAPGRQLSEDEVARLIAFTSAPAEEFNQNIINWGRYAELFRYDSDARVLLPARARSGGRSGGSGRSGPPGTETPDAPAGATGPGATSRDSPSTRVSSLARIGA